MLFDLRAETSVRPSTLDPSTLTDADGSQDHLERCSRSFGHVDRAQPLLKPFVVRPGCSAAPRRASLTGRVERLSSILVELQGRAVVALDRKAETPV